MGKKIYKMTSPRTEDYQDTYGVTAWEVYYASMVAAGVSEPEAYIIVYRPGSNSMEFVDGAIKELQRKFTGLQAMINAMKENCSSGDEKSATDGLLGRYKNKDFIISQLAQIAEQASDSPKEKKDALKEIASLLAMKGEEKNEEETIHRYVPLTCDNCIYMQSKKAREQAEREREEDNNE